ncbi:hypothetical protein [Fundidesulfovibrio putealis]|jgi:hypothetical protein|uniref:hypothetical protein n=1 Tax=Fundidesulfovibrio putealis TaxID=270496 RepID=UPI0003FD25EA|nr:hypothetical protein [Fundidesulfovibrio putealis]
MVVQRDVSYVSKLAPVAQLLEMLGHLDQPVVRSPEVFLAMAKEVWVTYRYLSARLNDEMLSAPDDKRDDHYFDDVERRAHRTMD